MQDANQGVSLLPRRRPLPASGRAGRSGPSALTATVTLPNVGQRLCIIFFPPHSASPSEILRQISLRTSSAQTVQDLSSCSTRCLLSGFSSRAGYLGLFVLFFSPPSAAPDISRASSAICCRLFGTKTSNTRFSSSRRDLTDDQRGQNSGSVVNQG